MLTEVSGLQPRFLNQNFQGSSLVICIFNKLSLQLLEGQERFQELNSERRVGAGLGSMRGEVFQNQEQHKEAHGSGQTQGLAWD